MSVGGVAGVGLRMRGRPHHFSTKAKTNSLAWDQAYGMRRQRPASYDAQAPCLDKGLQVCMPVLPPSVYVVVGRRGAPRQTDHGHSQPLDPTRARGKGRTLPQALSPSRCRVRHHRAGRPNAPLAQANGTDVEQMRAGECRGSAPGERGTNSGPPTQALGRTQAHKCGTTRPGPAASGNEARRLWPCIACIACCERCSLGSGKHEEREAQYHHPPTLRRRRFLSSLPCLHTPTHTHHASHTGSNSSPCRQPQEQQAPGDEDAAVREVRAVVG